MAWIWWQQRRADNAESRSIKTYLQQRNTSRILWDVVVEASGTPTLDCASRQCSTRNASLPDGNRAQDCSGSSGATSFIRERAARRAPRSVGSRSCVRSATAAARSRPDMAVRNAQRWFQRFGLDLVELAVYTRTQAYDPALAKIAARAGFCYIPGGDPGLVATVLRDSPVGDALIAAWRNGAALAGSSAGAMALCSDTLVRQSFPGTHAAPRAARPRRGAGCGRAPTSRHLWRKVVPVGAGSPARRRADRSRRADVCALEAGTWRCLGAGAGHRLQPRKDAVRAGSGALEGIPQPSTAG